jgi:hypothetical protein
MKALIWLAFGLTLSACSSSPCKSDESTIAAANLAVYAQQLQACSGGGDPCVVVATEAAQGVAYNLEIISGAGSLDPSVTESICESLKKLDQMPKGLPIDRSYFEGLTGAMRKSRCGSQ